MRLKSKPNIRFAGQITGVEGYVESAAMGLLAGRLAVAEMTGLSLPPVPSTTATGALVHHITGGAEATIRGTPATEAVNTDIWAEATMGNLPPGT